MNTSSRWDSSPRLPRFLRRSLLALFLALALTAGAFGQTASTPPTGLVAYPIADPLIYLGGGGIMLASHFLQARKPKPDLASLSVADIPSFDRLLYTTHRSEPLSIASDVTVAGTVLLPAVMIPRLSRSELLSSVVVYGEVLGLSYAVKNLVKSLVVRYRPYAYATDKAPALLAGPDVEDSFPSGHVTVAFAAAVATGYAFDLYNTNRGERAAMWGTALGLATATAVLRVWSGNHFVSDVVAAAAIGAAVGALLPLVHAPASLTSLGLPAPASAAPAPSIPILQWSVALP